MGISVQLVLFLYTTRIGKTLSCYGASPGEPERDSDQSVFVTKKGVWRLFQTLIFGKVSDTNMITPEVGLIILIDWLESLSQSVYNEPRLTTLVATNDFCGDQLVSQTWPCS